MRYGMLVALLGLALCACDREAPTSANATAQEGVPHVNVPAADHGRTPTCSEFIEHLSALIEATGRPNPLFNETRRPQAIASCERANNLEANAQEARCVMRASSPEMLGDCGNGRFMQQW